ncbi:TPA: DUF2502 domain-containing protein [Escherichia coli]|nr:DUF2502 domain-containing protein [Escherichia coli]
MKKMQSIVLALSLVLVAPMAAQAAEITLVPSVKLQIGYYWDGGHWRDHGWWKQHYEWRGNRWHPHGPPPPPRHHKKAHHDHHGGHGPGKHHR